MEFRPKDRSPKAPLEPVFLGYGPKRVYVPEKEGIEWTSPVKEICSVSNCISDGVSYDEGVPWWTSNRSRFYNSEDQALAAGDPGREPPVEVFAYWLLPVRFASDGEEIPMDLDAFLPTGSPLPDRVPPEQFEPIGYDLVEFDLQTCWGCSPLSCNGYAGEIPVNEYCLVWDLADAIEAGRQMQVEQPEPGDYVVFRVDRRQATAS